MKQKYIILLFFLFVVIAGINAQIIDAKSKKTSLLKAATNVTAEQRLDSIISIYDDEYQQSRKEVYSYQNNITTIVSYNLVNDEWQLGDKEENIYDDKGRMSSSTVYSYHAGSWMEREKSETEYEGRGTLPLTQSEFTWNSSSNSWVVTHRSEYTYNEGMLVSSLSYGREWYGDENQQIDELVEVYKVEYSGTWDHLTGVGYYKDENDWVLEIREEIKFNENFEVVSFIEYEYEHGSWKEAFKTECTYNADGKLLTQIEWYKDGDEWIEEDRDMYTYEGNYIKTLEYFYEGEIYRVDHYYYSDAPTTIETISSGTQISIYPNPAVNEVSFSVAGIVRIFDITGRICHMQNVNADEAIAIRHLPSGTYIYIIDNEQGSENGKLIKE